MSANTKKSMAALFILGVLVLLAEERSVVVLVPAAVLSWHRGEPEASDWPKLTGVRE